MVRILEYAQGDGPPWRRKAVRWLVCVGTLVPIVVVALVLSLLIYADWRHTRVTPEKAVWMWTFLYGGGTFVVERGDAKTVFNLQIGQTSYHMVGDRAAEAGADTAAQEWVRSLVKFLQSGEKGSPRLGTQYADELAVLTGQHFGANAPAWKSWIDAHLGEVKGGWEMYERLAELRRKASDQAGEPWGFRRNETLSKAAYENRMSKFWWANWWRMVLVVLCGGACVRVIAWARQPRSALIAVGRL